ncbi:MAG: GHKL domain-containing protein [candidate division Zixibacteria bacterium]|nr:GHKL domain-containing protein [candidate division Zixibacteria bacterium]
MVKLYHGLWNSLEKACALETDSGSDKRRKITLVLIAILCCLTGILSVTWNYLMSNPLSSIVLPFIFTSVVGIAVISFFFTKKFSILLYSFLFMILCIPVVFQWSVGGFTGNPGSVIIILWAILAPFGSLMFQDSRKALWWFSAYLFLIVISFNFDGYFSRFAVPTTYDEFMVGQGIVIVGFSITIFVTMRYFVTAFQREHARAEKLVVDLTDTNSELEKTLKELKETQSELVQSEKMASLGKLAAGIAHEINNPIGALKSSADNSTKCISKIEHFFETNEEFAEIKTNASIQKYLNILNDNSKVISSAGDRVADTVSSFLNFARLDGAEFGKVDINHSIDNTLTLIRQEIKAGTNVIKEYGDIPQIACYPGELNQVFMNLITNAVQAIKEQGEIRIHTFVEKNNLHIQITDTGVGIPKEELQGLFDPNFTKNGTRVKAGLGLFTCYNIMQKHHGRITVESEVGSGSTFTITIPTNLDEIIYST